MPAFAPLVLTDGATTPANHTFNPRDITGNVATLVESTGTPVGDRKLALVFNVTQSGRQRINAKLTIPVVQDVSVNGISKPTAVRTAYADVTLTFDSTSGLQERKDLTAQVASLLGNSLFKQVSNDLTPFY